MQRNTKTCGYVSFNPAHAEPPPVRVGDIE